MKKLILAIAGLATLAGVTLAGANGADAFLTNCVSSYGSTNFSVNCHLWDGTQPDQVRARANCKKGTATVAIVGQWVTENHWSVAVCPSGYTIVSGSGWWQFG